MSRPENINAIDEPEISRPIWAAHENRNTSTLNDSSGSLMNTGSCHPSTTNTYTVTESNTTLLLDDRSGQLKNIHTHNESTKSFTDSRANELRYTDLYACNKNINYFPDTGSGEPKNACMPDAACIEGNESKNMYVRNEVDSDILGGRICKPKRKYVRKKANNYRTAVEDNQHRNMYFGDQTNSSFPDSGNGEPGPLNRCDFCGYMSFFLSSMNQHVCSEISLNGPENLSTMQNVSNQTTSSKKRTEVKLFAKTQRIPLAAKPFTLKTLYGCTTCEYASSHKNNVLRHMRLVHKMIVSINDLLQTTPSSQFNEGTFSNSLSKVDSGMFPEVMDVNSQNTSSSNVAESCLEKILKNSFDKSCDNRNEIINANANNPGAGLETSQDIRGFYSDAISNNQHLYNNDVFNYGGDYSSSINSNTVTGDHPPFSSFLEILQAESKKSSKRVYNCKRCPYNSPLKWNLSRHSRSHRPQSEMTTSIPEEPSENKTKYPTNLVDHQYTSTKHIRYSQRVAPSKQSKRYRLPYSQTLGDYDEPDSNVDHPIPTEPQVNLNNRYSTTSGSADSENKLIPSTVLSHSQSSNDLLLDSRANQKKSSTNAIKDDKTPSRLDAQVTSLSSLLGCDTLNRHSVTSLRQTASNRGPVALMSPPPNTVGLYKSSLIKPLYDGLDMKHRIDYENNSLVVNAMIDSPEIKAHEAFSCYICGANIQSDLDMQVHLIAYHSGKSSYVCSICSLTYRRQADLNRHIRLKHSEAFNFQTWERSTPPYSSLYESTAAIESSKLCATLIESDEQQPLNLTARRTIDTSLTNTREQDEPLDLSVKSTSYVVPDKVHNDVTNTGPPLNQKLRNDVRDKDVDDTTSNFGAASFKNTHHSQTDIHYRSITESPRHHSYFNEPWKEGGELEGRLAQQFSKGGERFVNYNEITGDLEHNLYQSFDTEYITDQSARRSLSMYRIRQHNIHKSLRSESSLGLINAEEKGYNNCQQQLPRLGQLPDRGSYFDQTQNSGYGIFQRDENDNILNKLQEMRCESKIIPDSKYFRTNAVEGSYGIDKTFERSFNCDKLVPIGFDDADKSARKFKPDVSMTFGCDSIDLSLGITTPQIQCAQPSVNSFDFAGDDKTFENSRVRHPLEYYSYFSNPNVHDVQYPIQRTPRRRTKLYQCEFCAYDTYSVVDFERHQVKHRLNGGNCESAWDALEPYENVRDFGDRASSFCDDVTRRKKKRRVKKSKISSGQDDALNKVVRKTSSEEAADVMLDTGFNKHATVVEANMETCQDQTNSFTKLECEIHQLKQSENVVVPIPADSKSQAIAVVQLRELPQEAASMQVLPILCSVTEEFETHMRIVANEYKDIRKKTIEDGQKESIKNSVVKSIDLDMLVDNFVTRSNDEEKDLCNEVENLAQKCDVKTVIFNTRELAETDHKSESLLTLKTVGEAAHDDFIHGDAARNDFINGVAVRDEFIYDALGRGGRSGAGLHLNRTHQCGVCGERFRLKWEMARHLSTAHPSAEDMGIEKGMANGGKADGCTAVESMALNTDQAKVSSTGERRDISFGVKSKQSFETSVRSKACHARKPGMVDHLRLKRFQCSGCYYRSNYRSDVARHIRFKHDRTMNKVIVLKQEEAASSLTDYIITKRRCTYRRKRITDNSNAYSRLRDNAPQTTESAGETDHYDPENYTEEGKEKVSLTLKMDKDDSEDLRHDGVNKKEIENGTESFAGSVSYKNARSLPVRRVFCSICPYSTDKPGVLFIHQTRHLPESGGNQFKCKYCPYYVNARRLLGVHTKLHRMDLGIKGVAGRPAKVHETIRMNYSEAFASRRKTGRTRYFCWVCPYLSCNRKDYVYHRDFHRPCPATAEVFPGEVDSVYECHICPFWVRRLRLLTQHMKVHTRPYVEKRALYAKQRGVADFVSPLLIEENKNKNVDKDERVYSESESDTVSLSTASSDFQIAMTRDILIAREDTGDKRKRASGFTVAKRNLSMSLRKKTKNCGRGNYHFLGEAQPRNLGETQSRDLVEVQSVDVGEIQSLKLGESQPCVVDPIPARSWDEMQSRSTSKSVYCVDQIDSTIKPLKFSPTKDSESGGVVNLLKKLSIDSSLSNLQDRIGVFQSNSRFSTSRFESLRPNTHADSSGTSNPVNITTGNSVVENVGLNGSVSDQEPFYDDASKLFFCALCPYTNIRRELLNSHQRFHTTRSEFGCHLCTYSVSHLHLLIQHVRMHSRVSVVLGERGGSVLAVDSRSYPLRAADGVKRRIYKTRTHGLIQIGGGKRKWISKKRENEVRITSYPWSSGEAGGSADCDVIEGCIGTEVKEPMEKLLKTVYMAALELRPKDGAPALDLRPPCEASALELRPTYEAALELKPTDGAALELRSTDEAALELRPTDRAALELRSTDGAALELRPTDGAVPELRAAYALRFATEMVSEDVMNVN